MLLAGRVLPDSQPLQAAGVGNGLLLELAPAVSPPALALVLLLSIASSGAGQGGSAGDTNRKIAETDGRPRVSLF